MKMKALNLAPHVRCMADADGAVLLDLKAGKYYSLNGVGTIIWQKAEEGLAREDILEHLEKAFPIPLETLELDFGNFIAGLEKKGLLRASC